MKFFRNKEIRRTILLFLLLTAVATIGTAFFNLYFALSVLILCLLFIAVYLISTYRRYQKISSLSNEIDSILHGKDLTFSIASCSEGELAILESEIQKMTVRLREQQQKLQDDKLYLADSIADISHQIRTPLTSINLLIQLLQEPDISKERSIQILRELQTLLSRIDWLITTLLKISKLDAGTVLFKTDTVSMSEMIKKAVEPIQIPMELREQKLVINAAGTFIGDMDWTAEAVSNIVKNCMEHTPAKGTVHITAVENALYSEILIEDTGPGIAKEDLSHIFERFYKGKNSDKMSFGVGLALARVIISNQNGTLKAGNKSTGGALFTIRFYKGTV